MSDVTSECYRDLWLIPIGVVYPVMGYAAMSVVTRNYVADIDILFVCIVLVPVFGAVGVLLARALGAPFSSLGTLGSMVWMAVVGFGCVSIFIESLGAV